MGMQQGSASAIYKLQNAGRRKVLYHKFTVFGIQMKLIRLIKIFKSG
jgi:hypothetical protein